MPIASLLPTADAAKGAEVFKKCGACHTINQGGANGIGPNLYATVGEAVATGKGGFAFSDALKAKGGKWGFDELNAWLTSPRKYAPGTKMTFAGLSNPKDRADVILYLNTQGSNLPLPPPPAAAPAGMPPRRAGNAARRRRQHGGRRRRRQRNRGQPVGRRRRAVEGSRSRQARAEVRSASHALRRVPHAECNEPGAVVPRGRGVRGDLFGGVAFGFGLALFRSSGRGRIPGRAPSLPRRSRNK